MNNKNENVSLFLDELNHPLRKEIELLRNYILSANNKLTENIKWNGPNYCFDSDDLITMRIQPLTSKQIQLIFHRGTKKQEQPKNKLIHDKSGILIWKENDRAIASFKNVNAIESKKDELIKIVVNWITASK